MHKHAYNFTTTKLGEMHIVFTTTINQIVYVWLKKDVPRNRGKILYSTIYVENPHI